MDTIIDSAKLDELLLRLEAKPEDPDLLNLIAIGYFENSDRLLDREDYEYFKKAYEAKKTVKSIHNLAWFLYFEQSEIEWRWNQDSAVSLALQLQKECIQLQPNTYYPYYQYGYMLYDQKQYQSALEPLLIATSKNARQAILHTIGCCYFHLHQIENAREYFLAAAAADDTGHLSLYNLAVTEFVLGNVQETRRIADKLSAVTKREYSETVSGYEIGMLYYLLGDYDLVVKSSVEQGIEGIYLMQWEAISYSLFTIDKPLWVFYLEQEIFRHAELIENVRKNQEDWAEYSEAQRTERVIECEKDIAAAKSLLEAGAIKWVAQPAEIILSNGCGCLLFDCARHYNAAND